MSTTIVQQTNQKFAGKTPQQWRDQAADARRRSYESFQRSDTDGALSQWAHDSMAITYNDCAEVAEQGGTVTELELFDLEGNLLNAHQFISRYGNVTWVYDDAEGNPVYFSESAARSPEVRQKNNAKKGYTLGLVRWEAALNRKTGKPFAAKDRGPVEVISTDVEETA